MQGIVSLFLQPVGRLSQSISLPMHWDSHFPQSAAVSDQGQ